MSDLNNNYPLPKRRPLPNIPNQSRVNISAIPLSNSLSEGNFINSYPKSGSSTNSITFDQSTSPPNSILSSHSVNSSLNSSLNRPVSEYHLKTEARTIRPQFHHNSLSFNLDSNYSTQQQNIQKRNSKSYLPPPSFVPASPLIPEKPFALTQFQNELVGLTGNQINLPPPIPNKPELLKHELHLAQYPNEPLVSNSAMNNNYQTYQGYPPAQNNLDNQEDQVPELPKFNRKNSIKPSYIPIDPNRPAVSGSYFPNQQNKGYESAILSPESEDRRKSLSCLTMIGLDPDNFLSVDEENENIPGLLSQIVASFKRTSQEIMNGTQILDYLEKSCQIKPILNPDHDQENWFRIYSRLAGEALEDYNLFQHTVDDTLPILDGPEELYVVNISKLQNPSFKPNSVLTYLTRCYFPTCTPQKPCLSLSCPNTTIEIGGTKGPLKVVNVALNPELENFMVHKTSFSHANIRSMGGPDNFAPSFKTTDSKLNISEEAELWGQAVPQDVVDSVNADEKKRQELIFETIKTERDFVNDLEKIDKIFIKSLRTSKLYESSRLDTVIQFLFCNYTEILDINRTLLEALKERQAQNYVVEAVGDLFLEWAKSLECYAVYGSHLALTQDFIKKEIDFNPKFEQFLKECERHPLARRLSIQSFVGRATTRLGRYPLLLEGILKKTSQNSTDRVTIPKALELIRGCLDSVNRLAGEAEEQLKINYLDSHLYFKEGDQSPFIELNKKGRKLFKEGKVKRVSSAGAGKVVGLLFDNCLIFAKEKKKTVVEYHAVCQAIPIYAMHLTEDANISSFYTKLIDTTRPKNISDPNNPTDSPNPLSPGHSHSFSNSFSQSDANGGYAFSIQSFGKRPTSQLIICTTEKDRSQWVTAIREAMANSPQLNANVATTHDIFTGHYLNTLLLSSSQCLLSYQQSYLFGSDSGVHLLTQAGALKRILPTSTKVVQLEAIPEYHLLLVLCADRLLMAYPIETIDSPTANPTGTKVSENCAFFKVGICGSRHLVISTKHHSLKSYFKTMELVHFGMESRISTKNKLLWQSKNKTGLRYLKKFYVATIANNISFLKTRLSIACGPGFEIVNLDALDNNRGVPDLSDPFIQNHSSLADRFSSCTPLAMLRVNPKEFLLCYKAFGLYIDNAGRTSRSDRSVVEWLGNPTSFIMVYPNVVCIDPNFIEIHHAESGVLVQILISPNITHANPADFTSPILLLSQPTSTQPPYQKLFQLSVECSTIPPSPAFPSTPNLSTP